MPGTFAGRVALITGIGQFFSLKFSPGSSNGIGRAAARLFAREGAKVTLTGRNVSDLEDARKEVKI